MVVAPSSNLNSNSYNIDFFGKKLHGNTVDNADYREVEVQPRTILYPDFSGVRIDF